MIFLPDESKRTIIPRQIEQIRMENSPHRLTEYCLRGLYQNQFYYNMICANLPADVLPQRILRYVLDGPVTTCGLSECDRPLFTECHFSLMKKYDDLCFEITLHLSMPFVHHILMLLSNTLSIISQKSESIAHHFQQYVLLENVPEEMA